MSIIAHNIFSFLAIISILVFIHEFGHYWVAKKLGVKIDTFSIGFGKELFGWTDKSGTRWKVSLIPMGGYVKMFGDETVASTPDTERIFSEKEKQVAFQFKPLWVRSLIVFAGPAINFIFAILLLTGLFFIHGKKYSPPIIKDVIENSPAYNAGLKSEDKIIRINNKDIKRFKDISNVVMLYPNKEMEIVISRNGIEEDIKLTPETITDKEGNERTRIGVISYDTELKKFSFLAALAEGYKDTYKLSAMTLKAVGQMITGERSAKELSGILRIADYSGESVARGLATAIFFMALLSINLGLVNLFPIPTLDGGHLTLYAIEAIKGSPLSEKIQEYLFRFGFTLLIFIMLFATFNDLKYFKLF